MDSSAIEGAENIRNLVESLRRLCNLVFPCFVCVAGSLAAVVFVTGIVVGATAHHSMLAFGNGFAALAAVTAILGTDVWNIVNVIIPVLEMSVMERKTFSMTLREYFASKKGAQNELMGSKETLIGETYAKLISCLCRVCQMVLFWCPFLVALVALTCLAFGLGDDIPESLAALYIVFLFIAVIAIVGFIILRLRVRRTITIVITTLIDPYLQMMLKDLENDNAHSPEVVKDSDLEGGGGHPVAIADVESGEHSVLAKE